MLSFSFEDSINVYSFTARVTYRLAQALCIDVHEHHIDAAFYIDTTQNELFFWSLCNSYQVFSNAEGSQPWCFVL